MSSLTEEAVKDFLLILIADATALITYLQYKMRFHLGCTQSNLRLLRRILHSIIQKYNQQA